MRGILLLPAAVIFGLAQIIWELYWRIRKPQSVAAKVLSVGNILAGGTGKTTLTAYIARAFHQRGMKVAIVARGYKRESAKAITISESSDFAWQDVGDEPAMLARLLPNIKIYVDRDKTRGALKAAGEGNEIIIIDDGFQHRKLRRNLDIVCLSSDKPFGNGLLLPAGDLREPVWGLSRAGCLVWFDCSNNFNAWENIPVFHARKKVTAVRSANGSLVDIKGKKALAFCGIGNPDSFDKSLAQSGCNSGELIRFRDHHAYDRLDIDHIINRARAVDASVVITTMKDIVKVEKLWQAKIPLCYLEISLELDNEAGFLKFIGV